MRKVCKPDDTTIKLGVEGIPLLISGRKNMEVSYKVYILYSFSAPNSFNLHSFLNESVQVSHPYKTTGKITFLSTMIFILLDSKL
jgi:hypothetical protein